MKLTSASHDLPPGKDDAILFDSDLVGFGLRLRRGSGGKVIRNWVVQYRAHGRSRRVVVGAVEKVTAAEARLQARKLLAAVELGGDPQAEKAARRDRDALSFKHVATDFLEHKGGIKPRSHALLTMYLVGGPYLKPLHSIAIDKINRKDIAARLLAISKSSGAPTAVQVHSALSNVMLWSMQMGLIEANPIVGVFKPARSPGRERVLADDELRKIWENGGDGDYGKIIRLLILTGCRAQEIGSMQWPEIDLDGGTWTLPGERSKNKRSHTLPITGLMRSILETVPQRFENDFLFGRRGFKAWSSCKAALDARIGLPPWLVHDIRRSVATRLGDIGIQPHIIEQILNHQSGHRRGVAGTYNKSPYAREVAAAMAAWSDHVRTIVTGGERTVVQFHA